MSVRALHLAALPFPSHQGTQAAIAAMLEASAAHGRDAQLMTYAGRAYDAPLPYAVHRVGDSPAAHSLRSGPSLGKLVLDARMAAELPAVLARVAPDVIVAHHVEAAAVALAVTRIPVVFFAHTDLREELPTYGPAALAGAARLAGLVLDRQLAERAGAVATISPLLRDRFMQRARRAEDVFYVPTPWRLPRPAAADERRRARSELSIPSRACVLLYAGNLDAYQGTRTLLRAVALLAARYAQLVLLVATESDAGALRASAARLHLQGRLYVSPLSGEPARRRAHAAADIAVIPRLAASGLSIKLLDALSRAVPCAIMPAAAAGLDLAQCTATAGDDSSAALAAAIESLVIDDARREVLAEAGPQYIAAEHCPGPFLTALDRAIAHALAR